MRRHETNHPHKHQFSTRIYEPKHFHKNKTKLLILIEGEENIHTRHIFLNATRWRFSRTLPLRKQSKEKKIRKASHEVLTHLLFPFIYKQIPVIAVQTKRRRRRRSKNGRKRHRTPGGRSTAVKSGWVNRFHLSDSRSGLLEEENKTKREKAWRTWRKKIDFPPAKCNHMCDGGDFERNNLEGRMSIWKVILPARVSWRLRQK